MEYTPADGQYKYYIFAGKRSIAEEKGGQKVFYHRDHLGSTRALTDQNKKLVGLSKYDAWGKLESTNVYDEGVINGDFELGWKRWYSNFDNASAEIEAGCGVDGSTGLWFDDSDGSSWGWSNSNLYVSPDTEYQLTGYFKTDATVTGAKVQLKYYDASGTLIKVDDTGTLGASTQWKMFTLNSRAPANAATMEIFLTAEKNQSGIYRNVYFDKIVLKVPGLNANDSYDYTGKKEDEGTGLKYFGARFYDAEVGRFLTADTYTNLPNDERILLGKSDIDKILNIGFNDSQQYNQYSYCQNNPITRYDPDGHFAFVIPMAVYIAPAVITAGKVVAAITIGAILGKAVADARAKAEVGTIHAGDRTPGGRTMTGHAAQQANHRGFTLERIDKIIDNNKKDRVGKVDEIGRKTWEYTDNRGNKVVTNEKGDIVTVHGPPDNEAGEYEPSNKETSSDSSDSDENL